MTLSFPDAWTLDLLVEAYRQHQRRTRGLREETLDSHERVIRALVRDALGNDPIEPVRLSPSDVIEFVASMRRRWTRGSMKVVCASLRSFCRFLRVVGLSDGRLEAAVPSVPHWRLSTLPRYLSDVQLERVLASHDLSSPCGHRDRAILLCLATLGLRPREVADLRLEDIDWRNGTVEVHARKNRRGALLPLAREVGRAMAIYLCEERPVTGERRVFVKQLGPHRGEPISRHAVYYIAVRALHRAGVEMPGGGAYVFRHTVASHMVQRGASLKEVADLLGHRSIDTTAIYAKLDLPSLREVALPWPEVTR
jgi:integrase/recombinase XerD